jgi:alginate O-acetyltransferase complex protein AlgI
MVFSSTSFVIFLAITLVAYFSTRNLLLRQSLLVLASFVFYGFWDYRFVALLAYVTGIAWSGAWAVARWPERKKTALWIVIALQLGQLCFFKYTNFLLGTFFDLGSAIGLQPSKPRFDILLPIGVSFYTFHGISYVVDVYRGKLERPHNLLVVALYISFFPQLVAGPIVRADVFIPQSLRVLRLDTRDLIVGLKFITVGLIYKCIFADRLAPLVDRIFSKPEAFDNLTLLTAALGFYSQIYFDFAGYSTMAIGVSRLFGFTLPKNFDFPYRATSITEFWKRWHISLSTWLRDYLYIPLGGNRLGERRQYVNLMLTMLLGGLWHGSSYNFVVWGGLHGAALALHKRWMVASAPLRTRPNARWVWPMAAWLLTQMFVLCTWLPFRAESFADTGQFVAALSGLRAEDGLRSAPLPWALLTIPILADHLLVANKALPVFPWPKRPWLALVLLALCFAWALPFVTMELQSFIYFQF